VTLDSSPHIYACLVCGKFFRGKGRQTPAYTHSVDAGHFVFLHLSNGSYWCLPDNYEIRHEPSLRDISLALHPCFTAQQVAELDGQKELARDLFGRRYLPGFVGLNNLNKTDYLNCVVQALAHVRPLRDFFLLAGSSTNDDNGGIRNDVSLHHHRRDAQINSKKRKLPYEEFSPLAKSFSLLLRNIWSPHRFKSNVDPHMLVQAVSVASNKRFHVGKQAEAGEFLAWLLHQLHVGVGGQVGGGKRKKKNKNTEDSSRSDKRNGETVIYDTFMGKVEVTTVVRQRKRRGHEAALQMITQGGRDGKESTNNTLIIAQQHKDDQDDRAGSDDEETMQQKQRKREALQSLADEIIYVEEESVTDTDFLQLTLDIPEKPLFKDQDGGLVIPQEPLVNVLRKFDGVSFCDVLAMQQQQQSKVLQENDMSGSEGGIIVSKKRRYKLKKLPNYLILHLNRFKHNNFTVEKNPTIVMFPVKNFDLSSYIFREEGDPREKVPTAEDVRRMSTKELKHLLTKHGRQDIAQSSIEKEELLQHCLDFISTTLPDLIMDKYDLVANITHDIPAEVGREGTQRNPLEEGSYRCHVQHRATGQWYEMQDLNVTETMPQLIGVSESLLLIFERKGVGATV
ncbi:hypothetical protein ACHAWX_003087, partial [Stephanocyclus meneghinianus]